MVIVRLPRKRLIGLGLLTGMMVLLVVLVAATLAYAAFHLEYVEQPEIVAAPVAAYVAVDAWPMEVPPLPTPKPAPRIVAAPAPRPVAVGTAANGSTNRYVSPWGCEARHAQQWSASGKYWGKYQFDRSTWAAHGGSPGNYGSASEAEQDRVAARVQYDAWPNC